MPETRLQLVNSTLALLGEHSLTTSANQLGAFAVTAINTAITNIAQESRANVFEQVLAQNVTALDYLTPALTLPDNTIQVFSVLLRLSSGVSSGDKLIPLEYASLEDLQEEVRYSVVGRELFVSPLIARPFTLRVHVLTLPQLPTLDNSDSGLPDIVLPAVRHAAASILYASYLDDANGAAIQRNIAEALTDKLRNQYGNFRAKSFNVSKNLKPGYSFGGISSITGGLAYAPVDSPALTGTPTTTTPVTADNSTRVANTAYVQANLANYTPTTTLAANYLTQANAASTYALLNSPVFTGLPTAPTQAVTDNSTRLATTAFVKSWAFESSDGSARYLKVGNLIVKFNSTIVTLVGNEATITYSNSPAFSGVVTVVANNGDSGVPHDVWVKSFSASSFTVRVPTLATGSYRVNWVAFGLA